MPWTPLPRNSQGEMPTAQAILHLPTTQNHFDWADDDSDYLYVHVKLPTFIIIASWVSVEIKTIVDNHSKKSSTLTKTMIFF